MKSAPSADSLFKTLKAENEPWLSEVFVSLPIFERLSEEHSSILYGETGSGKTAMRLALTKQQGEGTFTALWTPEPILESPAEGTALAQQAMKQAMRACVEGLILEGNLPQRLGEPSSFIASALQWFLRNYLPFDADFYLQSLAGRLLQDEMQWYRKLLEQSHPSVVTEQTSLNDQIRLFLMILSPAKYDRLWLSIDGLERWTPRQVGEQARALLEAILSTLVFFDVKGVAFKFFLPASLKAILHSASGVERHRADEITLEWSVESLQALLEKRLAFAHSSKNVTLDTLCEGEAFLNWLKEFGGNSPRYWLQFAAPMVAEYRSHGNRLTPLQVREIIHKHPPPLRLDRERREVWIGKKRIPFSSASEFRLLTYLSARPGKICSLVESYYYAQEDLETIPDKADPRWVHKDTLRKRIDTIIWRVRKEIEPNPGEPIYLVTRRGQGLELLHVDL